jgi:hypothetical protein
MQIAAHIGQATSPSSLVDEKNKIVEFDWTRTRPGPWLAYVHEGSRIQAYTQTAIPYNSTTLLEQWITFSKIQ